MKNDLQYLIRTLEESGYFSNYLTFGEGNVRPWDWERASRFMSGKQKLLWDAFLCGKEVSRPQLEKAVSKQVVQTFLDRELCSAPPGKISFGANSLVSCGGFPLFVSRGSIGGGYFGEDSRILMSLRPSLAQGSVLSLSSGTGAEVFGLASSAGVSFTIAAPAGIQPFVTTNLELNGLSGRAAVTSPASASKSGPHDVIMARIPGLIEFGGIKFPELVSGGRDGNAAWDRTVRTAADSLTASGRLVFIGAFYGSKESKLAAQKFQQLFEAHDLSVNFSFSSKLAMELGIPIFNQAITIAELESKKPRPELLALFEKELETSGATHAYLVKGLAWKKRTRSNGGMIDLSEHYYGTWLT